jgi:hypothetical protein
MFPQTAWLFVPGTKIFTERPMMDAGWNRVAAPSRLYADAEPTKTFDTLTTVTVLDKTPEFGVYYLTK